MRNILLVLVLIPLGLVKAQSDCYPIWAQCDGKNWTPDKPSKCCQTGLSCVRINDYYFQCLASSNPPSPSVNSPSPLPQSPSPQISPNPPQSPSPQQQPQSPSPVQQQPQQSPAVVNNSPITVAVVYRTITTLIPVTSSSIDSNGNKIIQTSMQVIAIQSPEPQLSPSAISNSGDSSAPPTSPVIIGVSVAAVMGVLMILIILFIRRKTSENKKKSRKFYKFGDDGSSLGSLSVNKNYLNATKSQTPSDTSKNLEVFHVQPTSSPAKRRSDLIRFSTLSSSTNPFKDPTDSESTGSVYFEPASAVALQLAASNSSSSRFSSGTSSEESSAYQDFGTMRTTTTTSTSDYHSSNPFEKRISMSRKGLPVHNIMLQRNQNFVQYGHKVSASDPIRESAISSSTESTNATSRSSARSSMPAFYKLRDEGVDRSNNTLSPDWEEEEEKS